jgi:hypothetical protein
MSGCANVVDGVSFEVLVLAIVDCCQRTARATGLMMDLLCVMFGQE